MKPGSASLRCIHLLAQLTDEDLALLASVSLCEVYDKDATIASPWRHPRELAGIVTGEGRLYRPGGDGRTKTVARVAAGDLVGLPFLVETIQPRSVLQATLPGTTVWHIPPRHVQPLLLKYPAFALSVMAELATRLVVANDDREDLGGHHVPQQLARALLELAVEDEGHLIVPKRHEDLAAWIGSQRDYVAKVLGHFQEQGLVTSHQGRVGLVIEDAAGLAAIAHQLR